MQLNCKAPAHPRMSHKDLFMAVHKFFRTVHRIQRSNGEMDKQNGVDTAESLPTSADNQQLGGSLCFETSVGSGGLTTAPDRDASDRTRVTPSASDESAPPVNKQVMESFVSNTFNIVSSLNVAYKQLQSALSPYDPDKILVADRAVLNELRKLSEVKHSYLHSMAVDQAQRGPQALEAESKDTILKSYEGIIHNFHSQIETRNTVLESLKDMLAQTTLEKEKLERQVKRLQRKLAKEACPPGRGSAPAPAPGLSPTFQMLERALDRASEAARSFAGLLISFMKTVHWNLDAAADSIEPGILCYMKEPDKYFVFVSYVCITMLIGFENEDFGFSGSASSVPDPNLNIQECFRELQELWHADHVELVRTRSQSRFSKYCLKKFLDLIHPQMEESFLGDLEHRKQVAKGVHPMSGFYGQFLELARAMWVLQRLAFSFDPIASIFQVKRSTEFNPLYMESVNLSMEDTTNCNSIAKAMLIGFTVVPGFRVERAVIKCQVYVMPECD